jgi:GDP/UDP-N,N'-diacetylbacillosamine 2-epimerase (hydrolysing)
MKGIESVNDLELKIIVTGAHLSPEFGLTYQKIEKDGFLIDKKVEMLLSSDSEIGVTKSIGLGVIGMSDALSEIRPDLLVVLGDRFEILSAAIAAMIAKIPIAHLYGGEVTEGAFDESIRHAITKMSHLHFTATKDYYNRVIQLGEHPDRVFNVGSIGVDNIKNLSLLSREEFEKSINFKLGKRNLLITFHSVTLEKSTAKKQFENLLKVLDEQMDTHLIFTKANADIDGRLINKMIDDYVALNYDKAIVFTSLGQLRYFSAMKHVDGVVGNSSSGLIEAPSFKIGTVNIGDRQGGRINAESVINCSPSIVDIQFAFRKLFSQSFNKQLQQVVNPYGNGESLSKILDVIRSYPLKYILKKKFYDIDL